MDLFAEKQIKPMLIGAEGEPFDSPDYIYELKLDGERAVVYLDPAVGTELRNKRNKRMLPIFPELAELHKQVKKRCVLDGEYVILKNGKPDFFEIQRRSLMSNRFKIELAAAQLPVSFVAFDILQADDLVTFDLPLMKRKALLEKNVKEGGRLAISRWIELSGLDFYQLAEAQELEGIVAKRKDSRYYLDKRTKEWIKIKNLKDDDYVVCGYINKGKGVTSIVLGQYRDGSLIYKGHVTLGVSGRAFEKIARHKRLSAPLMDVPSGHGNENAVWMSPDLVCTVKYMQKTQSGSLRQPVFKGLREDKVAEECQE